MARKPTDTAAMPPEVHLVEAMAMGASNSIVASEARGQREIVASEVIPVDGADEKALTALGFKLGPVDEADPIFRSCELPEGWKREGSDHSMWSYIVDERGFRQIAIFYKAAFYDRSAHMRVIADPETRAQADAYDAFNQWCPWSEGWTNDRHKDGDNVVYLGRECETDENGAKVYDHDAHNWKFTGRTRERVVAPDGSTVSEQELAA